MEIFIFARFHARKGQEGALAAALREQIDRVRAEPGCLDMGVYASVRNPRLFWIHSRWADEAAFQVHADLPNTQRFMERVEPLIDHPFDATRTRALE
ncbi:MAG TPA: putative quinol monooxygenase [Dongiaceae bacterium]|jgi:quinol monooxygenase YgiN|nr:putative quinol monooxygenase [Dongiaceae bacterium]